MKYQYDDFERKGNWLKGDGIKVFAPLPTDEIDNYLDTAELDNLFRLRYFIICLMKSKLISSTEAHRALMKLYNFAKEKGIYMSMPINLEKVSKGRKFLDMMKSLWSK